MHIAVDARPLSVPITGIGQHTRSLLNELLRQSPPDWHWSLYSDRPLPLDFSESSAVTYRTFPISGRFVSALVSQLVFPLWAARDRIDVFWSPRHHLPRFFLSPLKTVVTIHDLVWLRYPDTMRWLNLMLEKRLMPASIEMADRVVTVSNATASELKREFPVSEHKLTVIGNAATAINVEAKVVTEDNYLLFVGTLEPRKNLRRLINAFSKLLKEDTPGYRLIIAGGAGWGGTPLSSLTNSLGIDDHVQLLGYLTDEQLHQLYRGARALVMPSLYEGFGIPLLEAMQYGTPVITSNCSSLPEVAGDAGLLVDPYSEDELCQAMRDIICDDDLHSVLSARAIERARAYSWHDAATRMLKVFESI